jgi:hypothetical protein
MPRSFRSAYRCFEECLPSRRQLSNGWGSPDAFMRSIPALDRRSGRMAAILRVTTIKHGPQVGERGAKLHEQITASSSNRTAPSASSLAKSETVASPAMERPVQVSCSIGSVASAHLVR